MERKTPLTNVSSIQRLSLMIDSLHDVQSNDELLGTDAMKTQPSNDSLGGPPNTKTFIQPPSTVGSFSPYQGSSMSDYSGVVNNATEMIRVTNAQVNNVRPLNVKNTVSNLQLNSEEVRTTSSSSSESDYNKKPLLPNFPTENDLRKTSYASRLPTFITERSETPVETLTSTPDKSVSTSQESQTDKSIPSHLNLEIDRDNHSNNNEEDEDVEQTERELMALNIRDPAYSHHKETSINDIDNTDIIEVSDHSSINSSIAESLPPPSPPYEDKPLMTTTEQLKNESNSESSGSPSVPPRSKDRPRANRIPTEKRIIEAQESNKYPAYYSQNRKSITSIQSTTNKSDSYYSAASYIPDDLDNEQPMMINDPNHFLAMNKTVPMIHQSNNRLSHDEMFGSTPSKIHTIDLDNIYEDIHPATLPPKNVSSNIIQVESKPKENVSPEKKKKNVKHKKKKSKELRQFDADTINQLLNVTQGTLIGSEFNNLGMKVEEKRLLERLVDSLSRLTADMVLDPNRYEEGLRRLNKATKALEGFEGK